MKIWKNKVDNKYDVFVDSDKPYHGFLIIKDGDKELFKEETHIAYDARFGPDLNDVYAWESKCIEIIDKIRI